MADFLLELLSEEIPARMQAKARNDLARLFAECTSEAGLGTGAIETYSTPRRLALIAREIADATEASREEIKGPRSSAPAQALEGFLRKTGLRQDQLEDRDGVYFAVIERAGKAAAEVIADATKRIVADFPWPKSMRWGDGSQRWVRPLHGIVAILGEDIVPVQIDGVTSGAATLGHRFHHAGPITIGGASDYVEKLRACHVIVDQDERERLIRDGAAEAARAAGLTLLPDAGLVVENAGLTEWPVPLLGRFDDDFLDVPREVIVLTMRTNQKYFACTNDQGLLAPAFVCVANIDASDGGEAIAQGNARVLAARLADARFFWEQDLKVPLEQQTQKLGGIVFHEKLGTVADKVERVAKLARWLVEERIVKSSPERGGEPAAKPTVEGAHRRAASTAGPLHYPSDGPPPRPGEELANLAERAARLAKADLVTGMVGEFPELQGVIGGYLAEAQGEPKAIAEAVRDHYGTPSAPASIALALADKLDTICAFFAIDEKPTGSKDPFAVRRAALGSIEIIVGNALRLDLTRAIRGALANLAGQLQSSDAAHRLDRTAPEVLTFFADRLKVQQREAGVRHDLIDAVFALGGEDDLVRLLARVTALQEFVGTDDGTNLLVAYKRAANILKKEKWEANRHPGLEPGPASTSPSSKEKRVPNQAQDDALEPEERTLAVALDQAEPKASAAIDDEDFTGAMAALASLRAPIDQFFDHVTVNDPDAAKRERRLNLLMRFRDAVNRVAHFSKIEG